MKTVKLQRDSRLLLRRSHHQVMTKVCHSLCLIAYATLVGALVAQSSKRRPPTIELIRIECRLLSRVSQKSVAT